MYQALFFDLDGTLLDTLTDIRAALNEALLQSGFSFTYSKQECHYLIGNGADYLVHKALKDQDTPANFAKLKAAYMPLYAAYQERHTKPFNGMVPTLQYLHNRGILLFVCSNKPDALAKRIVPKFYGEDLFTEIRGQKEGEPRKPDPFIPNSFIAHYALDPKQCLFVGDSLPDLLTANNAGLPLCLCMWGYGFYKPDLLEECKYVIKKPKELAQVATL
jgi:phosphoglycolate phosphatase